MTRGDRKVRQFPLGCVASSETYCLVRVLVLPPGHETVYLLHLCPASVPTLQQRNWSGTIQAGRHRYTGFGRQHVGERVYSLELSRVGFEQEIYL